MPFQRRQFIYPNSCNSLLKLCFACIGAVLILSCQNFYDLSPEIAAPAEEECGFQQNSNGARISWNQNLPIQIIHDTNVNFDYKTKIEIAVNKWNSAAGKSLFTYNKNSPQKITSSAYAQLSFETDWAGSSDHIQGLTYLAYTDNQIYQAKIRLNADNFNFDLENSGTQKDIDLESLLIHELGHTLGLKHKTQSNTVMQPFLAEQVVRNKISAEDKANIGCEYGN